MSPLQKALPLILFLAGAVLGQGTPVDCTPAAYTITTATPTTGLPNASSAIPCVSWRVTYSSTGFSAFSIQFETSPDNSSWTAVPNNICNSSNQPPCVIDGTNPITTTGNGTFSVRAYGKFIRLNPTSVTGSGTITARVFGYKGLSANLGNGGSGGGGSGTVNAGTQNQIAYYPSAGTAVSGNPATADSSGNISTPGTMATGNAGGTSGSVTLNGATSGNFKIQAAAVAGSPNPWQPPIATSAVGGFLTSDGGNPQQLSWQGTITMSGQTGLGDGLNAIAAGTYLQSFFFNTFPDTYTITGINCFTNNNGSSTLNATNGAGTALLTGAITCGATFPGVGGTQSGTTTIAVNDGIKFTFVSDGASLQTTWTVTATRRAR